MNTRTALTVAITGQENSTKFQFRRQNYPKTTVGHEMITKFVSCANNSLSKYSMNLPFDKYFELGDRGLMLKLLNILKTHFSSELS